MNPVEPVTEWPECLRFFGRFVRHPRTVGAVFPSSRQLALAMVAPMARSSYAGAGPVRGATPVRPRTIVELGPGTGAFTRAIVEQLHPGDRFLGVELDPVFAEALRHRWPGVDCVCASAESLGTLVSDRCLGPVDHIVSGLPFAMLPARTTRRIVEAIAQTLGPAGTFTTFHYLQSYGIPAAMAFRRQMNDLMGAAPVVRFVPWNLPPAVALSWTNQRLAPCVNADRAHARHDP